MNVHIFTGTLWDGYSVHFVIQNKYCIHVEQKHAVRHTACLFSKKFCIVVEKPFETKMQRFRDIKLYNHYQILNLNALPFE